MLLMIPRQNESAAPATLPDATAIAAMFRFSVPPRQLVDIPPDVQTATGATPPGAGSA